ncbi:MAG: zinc ABC transporter substrate-binding protein [Clostridia bacterium]|nr:zinc ABC transporter substrate-binding protein [Clostridia bacterium]
MKRLLRLAAALLIALTALASCGRTAPSGRTVAASFYPVYVFTRNLLDGTDVAVECMAEQQIGCLHDYNLRAGDVRLLADADALVVNGAGMETFLNDVIENAPDLAVIDSSTGVPLLTEAHGDDANSHIWMSVANARIQIANVRDGLTALYPDCAETIGSNYARYDATLAALEKEMRAAAAPLKGKAIITFHEAYDYMADELGLSVVDSIESDEGGEPSAKELARLCDEIDERGVTALFTEPNYRGSAAGILAAQTGAAVYVLNPVLSGGDELSAYEDCMRANLEILTKAVN